MSGRDNAFGRLFRGETSFDFAGRWRRWFVISGAVIFIGLASLGVRGLNFSIDFKGGTIWRVPSQASVSQIRGDIGRIGSTLSQANITTLINRQTGNREIEVQAPAKVTSDSALVAKVTSALGKASHVSANEVQLNDVGPSWGSDITNKAVKAVIIFLIAVTAYIWLRFEAKMALAALVALLHDILVTVGIYSLSGFQVSPDTVIAFLTILGYSLYDTIVVFDKVQENTKGLASTGRFTYTETVNLSMNQVLARSLNTSFVAIIPILSILVIGAGFLGASALEDFGLALFIGLATGAYSSIFIASPLLALLKEREPRYAQIRSRLTKQRPGLTPASAAAAGQLGGGGVGTVRRVRPSRPSGSSSFDALRQAALTRAATEPDGTTPEAVDEKANPGGANAARGGRASVTRSRRPASDRPASDSPAAEDGHQGHQGGNGAAPRPAGVPPRSNRPPPRPRKKRRR